MAKRENLDGLIIANKENALELVTANKEVASQNDENEPAIVFRTFN
jgi:hypothetical protein